MAHKVGMKNGQVRPLPFLHPSDCQCYECEHSRGHLIGVRISYERKEARQ